MRTSLGIAMRRASRRLAYGCVGSCLSLATVTPALAQTPAAAPTTAVSSAPPAAAAAPQPSSALPAGQPTTAPSAPLAPASPPPTVQPPPPASAAPSPPPVAATPSEPEPELPLYTPLPGEAFVLPEKPPPPPLPPPPELNSELVLYTEYHSLSGGVGPNGAIGEVGIRFGGTVSQLVLGYIPANGLGVAGLTLSNLLGWKLAQMGKTATFSILAPSFAFKVATDFEDTYISPELTALGLAYVRCTGFPLSVKIRAPSFSAWLPIEANEQEYPDDAVAIVSVGFGVEVGVVFF